MSPARALARPGPAGGGTAQGEPAHAWWPWVRRGLALGFLALVAYLLLRYARGVAWSDVGEALSAMPAEVLAAAMALAACSHLLYSCFDLLGRHSTGHRLPTRTVMAVTFVSYAFNLNLGSLVGGVAFRYRLYSRLGLVPARITQVMSLSMLTNWLGYLVLAGVVCLGVPPDLPDTWRLSEAVLPGIGLALLALPAAWIVLCMVWPGRSWALRGHRLALPGWRIALLQLTMSCANWMLIAGVLFVLLQGGASYPTVLGVLLLAAVAGVITHVPAGLGVLEAVFVALLAGAALSEPQLIAMLLCYRAIYYLAPLVLAAFLYLSLELRLRRQPRAASAPVA